MTESPAPFPMLPMRDPMGHKGTFGTVAIVGGCAHGGALMLGGPCISAVAALRVGAGLARLALPAPILAEGLAIAPSATGVAMPVNAEGDIDLPGAAGMLDGLLRDADCVAVGPGLGTGEGAEGVVLKLIGQQETPIVVDADAINAMASIPELTRSFRAHAVLTPHPGEYRRLASALQINLDPTDPAQRGAGAEALAQRLGCVVALKGAHTVVSDGQRTWTDASAPNAALGTAGTGDALTGVIAGLVAQHHRRPILAGERSVPSQARGGLSLLECASLGALLHSMAARAWAERAGVESGMLAMELCELIPEAVRRLHALQGGAGALG
ncbi:MAG: NAD(P)H-hydrate dehydratase [Phycisphaeraceae bacterium]|nr:NAD(P)H-hydrate dehydratase [Phycisphaeraceae bacterium]MCB9846928.1 NAD(P)H-hydrate dehydratase [Phycisphaeraceae bacterium]